MDNMNPPGYGSGFGKHDRKSLGDEIVGKSKPSIDTDLPMPLMTLDIYICDTPRLNVLPIRKEENNDGGDEDCQYYQETAQAE